MPNLFIDVEARFAKFQDSLDRVKRQAESFTSGLTRSFAGLATVVGGIGLGLGVGEIVRAAVEAEQASARLDIVMRNLGDASGISRERVEQLAGSLSEFGKFDDDDIRSAAAEILKFGNISSAVFEDALRSAKGVAAFFGEDLRSAAQKVAKALADPEAAFKLLKEVGIAFSDSQKDVIKTLGKTQGIFAQQEAIVSELAKRYGKLDEELNQGLTGTLNDLNKEWGNFLETLGLTAGKLGPVSLAIRGVADAVGVLRSGIDKSTSIASLPDSQQRTPIDEIIPRAPAASGPLGRQIVPGSRTPISDVLPISSDTEPQGFASDSASVARLRPAPTLSEDDRKRLQKSLGPGKNQLILPSEKTDAGTPDPKRGASGRSDFESLQRSLTSQLNQERQLTEEIKLVEDERFNSLSKNQKQSLVTLAQRIDLITEEKRASEISEQSESAARSIQENSVKNELDIIERRKVSLTQEFEDRKLGVQEYYSLLAAEEDNAFNVQLQHLETLRQQQLDVAGDAGSDERGVPNRSIQERLQATAQVAQLEQEITRITRDREDNVITTARAARDEEFRSLEQQIKLTQDLNSLQGRSNIEFDREALLFQFRDLSAEIKESLTFKVFIDATLAEQQFDQFAQRVDDIQSRRQVREQSASISRDSGTITQGEFQTSVVEIRKQSVQLIEEEIEKLTELAKSNDIVFGEEQITRLEVLRNELTELKQSTDIYLNSFKDASESEVADFFEAIISGSESAEDALKKLGNSIKANINRKVAQEFTDILFAGIQKATASEGGLTGFVESLSAGVQSFFGGGGQQAPQQQGISFDGGGAGFKGSGGLGLNLESASGGVGAQGGGLSLGSGGGEVSTEGIEAFNAAANEGSSALTGFSQGTLTGGESASLFSSTLDQSTPNVGQSMTDLAVSTTTAETGNQSLGTASGTAAIAVNAFAEAATAAAIKMGASSAAGVAAADGAVFSGGYHVAFADGGIVSAPTTFPIEGGRTGLMGEAGVEAIMPARAGAGGYEVRALRADGGVEFLSLSRDGTGKLSVVLPAGMDSVSQAPGQRPGETSKFSGLQAPSFLLQGGDTWAATNSFDSMSSIGGSQSYAASYGGDVQLTQATIGAAADAFLAPPHGIPADQIILQSDERERLVAGGATIAKFASGGVLDDGRIEAFAGGGIVSSPTFFPIKGGKRGLMGEAGPEAIVPVKAAGGGFAATGVLSSGKEISVSLTRNAAGKLAIQMPDIAPPPAAAEFADGDVFERGLASNHRYSFAYADGGVFISGAESYISQAFAAGGIVAQGRALPVHQYAYGGVANKPQVAVFGEGSMNEAFVPLPDGKSIPVTLEDSGKNGGGDIYVTQNITTPDVAGFARTKNQMANELRAALGSASRRM